MTRVAVIVAVLAAACTDDRKTGRLSDAECDEVVGLHPRTADVALLDDPDMIQTVRAHLITHMIRECRADRYDRKMLECLRAARAPDQLEACVPQPERRNVMPRSP